MSIYSRRLKVRTLDHVATQSTGVGGTTTATSRVTLAGVSILAALPYGLLVVLPDGIGRALLSEDSLVEWTGALAWLAASVLFGVMVVVRRRRGSSTLPTTFWLVGLALMCFLAAGEEISWGQRLFGYDTPTVVAQSNLQGEMNLHNLGILDVRESVDGDKKVGLARWLTFNRASSLIWLGYLVALPLLVHVVPRARSLATRWGPPIPPLGVAFAAAVNYITFFLLSASLTAPETSQKLLNFGANEIKESVIAVLFAATAYVGLRQVIEGPDPARGAGHERRTVLSSS